MARVGLFCLQSAHPCICRQSDNVIQLKLVHATVAMHQSSIDFVLWSVCSWFKTGQAWTGRPGNGGLWLITLSTNYRGNWDCWLGKYLLRGSVNFELISSLGASTWSLYTLCITPNLKIAQRECGFQIELLKLPIHLKITLPLHRLSQVFHGVLVLGFEF